PHGFEHHPRIGPVSPRRPPAAHGAGGSSSGGCGHSGGRGTERRVDTVSELPSHPQTRTPGWFARLFPCRSSVGSGGSVFVPADIKTCPRHHQNEQARAPNPKHLIAPVPVLRVHAATLATRNRTFPPGSQHHEQLAAKHRIRAPS